ncbi:uncharacterized protein V6R79_004819 [Siganus canaliculatus]
MPGSNTCAYGPRWKKAALVSPSLSVRLTPSPGKPSVPSPEPHLRDQSSGINWQSV